MRAVVFEEPGKVRVDDVPEPIVQGSGEAVVRVDLSAICGSDMHAFHGRIPMRAGESLGHEAVGVIAEAGPAVRGFRDGDRVVVSCNNACGDCWYCRNGMSSLCDDSKNLGFGETGGGLGGAQAEFVRVPRANFNLLRIPDGVTDDDALFVGDVLTTGHYGVGLAEVQAGESVVILGAGPVGLLAAEVALLHGAGLVFVVDRVRERLERAERIGAVPIGAEATAAKSEVRSRTEGRGADVGVEAVGSLEAFDTTYACVRRGGRVVVLGVHGPETLEFRMSDYCIRAKRILFAGLCPIQAWWARTMEAVEAGRLRPSRIISHRLGLEDAPHAYELFDQRRAMKVVLDT